MSLSERLRIAREKADLTQKAVTKLTGINYKTISNWENGVSNPDPASISILADVYNVSTEYIFEKTDDIKFSSKSKSKTTSPTAEFIKGLFADDAETLAKLNEATIKINGRDAFESISDEAKGLIKNALLLAIKEVEKIKGSK